MNINPNPNKKLRLGDLLLQAGIIKEEQLNEALSRQRTSGKRLGEVLMDEGYITQKDLTRVLETQLGIKSINLKQNPVDPKVVRLIPENLTRRHVIIPVQVANGRLLLAMRDPLDQIAIQDVRLLINMPIIPVLATQNDIIDTIEKVFGETVVNKAVDEYVQSQDTGPEEIEDNAQAINSAPIVRLVKSMLENAVFSGASDLHIEPNRDKLRVRTRVDGVLYEVMTTGLKTHGAVVSRIKIMAGMDIANKRLPQDGTFTLNLEDRNVDFRVSTLPTNHGEKVVLRILDRGSFVVGKEKLGLGPADIEKFNRLINKPHGIILVTGPTGSGKTTTLYSMLAELNDDGKNIITLEDPIELDMRGINQTQINMRSGLDFPTGLRSILRQDPNIIMVGEIRDTETSKIAARAALTGHLVLSTLHTNDAPGAVARLIDMGVEPYLISSSLIAVIAQQLVRRICPECAEKYEAGEREKRILHYPPEEPLMLSRGRGCNYCYNSGYKGRIGVFEILEVNRELRVLIDKGVPVDVFREAALKAGMVPLQGDARQRVLQGITTLDEMLRITII